MTILKIGTIFILGGEPRIIWSLLQKLYFHRKGAKNAKKKHNQSKEQETGGAIYAVTL